MRALVYQGPDQLVLAERPVPRAGQGEVVLRVDACGICGTDLRIASGAHSAYRAGTRRVPGHEVAGTVAEAGPGAQATEGHRVFVAPNYGCLRCRPCQRGQVNLCEKPRAIGITEDGGLADYLLLPRELIEQGNLLPVGDTTDQGAAALTEPLACALRASRACGITPGDAVLVYGAGPVGLLHVALARLAGAAVVVVCDPHEERRRRALEWGATGTAGPGQDLRAALATGGTAGGAAAGADVVIVAAPAPQAQAQALEVAAAGGRVSLFAGLPRGRSEVALDTNLIHYKELVVSGATGSTVESCRAALDLIQGGQVDTGALIDTRLDLDSAPAAFELARSRRALKIVIEPSPGDRLRGAH